MSTQYPLPEIAAAQLASCLTSFDPGWYYRKIARNQQIHAHWMAQLDAVNRVFDEGGVKIVLKSETQRVVLRLGDAAADLYPSLRDILDERLRALETKIVHLHLDAAERALDDAQYPTPGPDYLPDILALCTPAGVQQGASTPTPPAPRRAGVAATGTGLSSISVAATAVAA